MGGCKGVRLYTKVGRISPELERFPRKANLIVYKFDVDMTKPSTKRRQRLLQLKKLDNNIS